MAENYEGEAIGFPNEVALEETQTPSPNYLVTLNGLAGTPRLVDEDGNDLPTDDEDGTITVSGSGGGSSTCGNSLFVDVDGSDATGTRERFDKPYLTIAEALANALAGDTIFVRPGTFIEDALAWDDEINLVGSGMDATIISMSGTTALTVSSENVTIRDLSIVRAAAGNAAKIFHCSVTGRADWLENIQLTNVRISNPNGQAVGTLTSVNRGCEFSGASMAIDLYYGSQSFDCTFENPTRTSGDDTEDVPECWVIKYAQSTGNRTGDWGYETYASKHATFQACTLIGLGVNTKVFEGLPESDVAGFDEDWMGWELASPVAHLVSFEGCVIRGPLAPTSEAGVGPDQGPFSSYGTNAATCSGAFGFQGGKIYGSNTFIGCYSGHVTGAYIVNLGQVGGVGTNWFINHMRQFVIEGGVFPVSPYSAVNDIALSFTAIVNGVYENDMAAIVGSWQQYFRGARVDVEPWSGERFGWEGKNLAIYMKDRTTSQFMETEVTDELMTSEGTAECWFKINGTTRGASGLFSYNLDPENTGWYVVVFPSETRMYAQVGNGAYLTATGLGVLANATLTSTGINVTDGDTVTIGSRTYRFKDTMAAVNDVKRGASAAITLDNLKAAINLTGTSGVEWFAGTTIHPTVSATTNTDTTQLVEAKLYTTAGADVEVSDSAATLSWSSPYSSTTLSGNFFDTGWHHVALTWSGTTAKLWLDGVLMDTDTCATPTGATRLALGAFADETPNTAASLGGVGMLKRFAFSNVVRYTGAFTPAVRQFPDADTLVLFGGEAGGPLTWKDQCGNFDAVTELGVAGSGAGTAIVWVPEDYTPDE